MLYLLFLYLQNEPEIPVPQGFLRSGKGSLTGAGIQTHIPGADGGCISAGQRPSGREQTSTDGNFPSFINLAYDITKFGENQLTISLKLRKSNRSMCIIP